MTPPIVDLSDPEAVKRELLDEDAAVRAEFAAHLDDELTELAGVLAVCFRLIPALNAAANQAETMQTALVTAFAYGVLDDIVTSTKLLFAGKLPASGNLMRQAVEGIAMSFLCSADAPLIIKKNKNQPPVTARYWQKVDDDDHRTQGHKAIEQLEWNAGTLGVSGGAVANMRTATKHYNAYSHCGKLTIASRVALERVGTAYVGGHFDPAKLDAYRSEMNQRIGLCRLLPPFLEHLAATMNPHAKPGTEVEAKATFE